MRLDFLRSKTARSRSLSALGMICAFLFAMALSDAPRLHQFFHKALGPDHECAVTIFLSGASDHSTCAAAAAMPPGPAATPVFVLPRLQAVEAALEFSRLEHAPPALA